MSSTIGKSSRERYMSAAIKKYNVVQVVQNSYVVNNRMKKKWKKKKRKRKRKKEYNNNLEQTDRSLANREIVEQRVRSFCSNGEIVKQRVRSLCSK